MESHTSRTSQGEAGPLCRGRSHIMSLGGGGGGGGGGRSHMMSLCMRMWGAHDMMSLWGRSHMTCGGGVTCCEGCYTYHVASGLCEWAMWAGSKREGVEASTMGFLCFPPFFSLAAGGIG